MKNILVPIDFSPVSENALIAATAIARRTSQAVTLFHLIDYASSTSYSVTGDMEKKDHFSEVYVLQSIQKAKIEILKIKDDIRFVGVRFETVMKVGNMNKDFYKLINEEDPELIIMGTGGSIGIFKGLFNNTNTEDVAMHAPCMVLSIKDIQANFTLKNLIFATDFEDDATEFVQKIIKLQELFFFKIHILYVDALLGTRKDIKAIEKAKEQFIKENKIQEFEFHIVKDFTEYNGIVEYATQVKADVIALSTHQHKGLHWLGGIAEDLINYAPFAVLTYKI